MGNSAGVNSASIVRHYPRGPPACSQCPPGQPPTWIGGFIEAPSAETCARLFGPDGCSPVLPRGPASAAFLALYALWALTAALALAWNLRRNFLRSDNAAAKHTRIAQSDPVEDEEAAGLFGEGGSAQDATSERIVRVDFFRHHAWAWRMGRVMLCLNGLVLLVFWLVLTVDFYMECEFTWGAIESACFFGTFRVFGSYENNAESFFVVWTAMVILSFVVSWYLDAFLQWLHVPCDKTDRTARYAKVIVRRNRVNAEPVSRAGRLLAKLDLYGKGVKSFLGFDALPANCRVVMCPVGTTEKGLRYFEFECGRYSTETGRRIRMQLDDTSVGSLFGLFQQGGLPPNERRAMQDRCGNNEVNFEMPTIGHMVLSEFTEPFYAYQLTIYLIWIWWTYWFVGIWLLLVVLISAAWAIHVKRNGLSAVRRIAAQHEHLVVEVLQPRASSDEHEYRREGRDSIDAQDAAFLSEARKEVSFAGNNTVTINARDLVCGDVVRISPTSPLVPADIVIVSGDCAVDEAGLTGESVPRGKAALSLSQCGASAVVSIDSPNYRMNMLFSGTRVLSASKDCFGIVLAVGSDSHRGKMLSLVLHPEEQSFRTDEELPLAIFVLLLYSILAFVLALVFQAQNGAHSTWPTKLAYGVFTVSQILSPMLKVALVAGRVAAMDRLKKKGVVCLDSKKVDMAGDVKVFCFDKTGTLTQNTTILTGFLSVAQLGERGISELNSTGLNGLETRIVAATCHSLSFDSGQKPVGSHLEQALFEASEAVRIGIEEYRINPGVTAVIRRRFIFDAARRTMSCIVETNQGDMFLVIKGAPESIASRAAVAEKSFADTLVKESDRLAGEGKYLIAMGLRRLNGDDKETALGMATRDDLESNLTILGLCVFLNPLRDDAHETIAGLSHGNIRSVIITGDNAPCANAIARECGIIDGLTNIISVRSLEGGNGVKWHLHKRDGTVQDICHEDVLTEYTHECISIADSAAFRSLRCDGVLHRLLPRVRVLARMDPLDKASFVRLVMEHERCAVGFAGDGANDAAALRQATIGLSMSSSRDSELVASFTCESPNGNEETPIRLALELICEGRCALTTSLASYKLLVVYGMVFSIIKLASFYLGVLMPILGYLMIDVCTLVPLTFLVARARPLAALSPRSPPNSLLGAHTIASVVLYMIWFLIALGLNLSALFSAPEYQKWPSGAANLAAWWYLSDNMESSTLWITCFAGFTLSSVVFSQGGEFRQPLYKLPELLVYIVGMVIIAGCAFLLPVNKLSIAFHIASEDFNRDNSSNPVWVRFQENGGSTSPGMSYELREKLCFNLVVFFIVANICEALFVQKGGPEKMVRYFRS